MLSVNFGINQLEILSLGIYLDLISTFGPYGSKLLQPATLLKVTHCGCFSRFSRYTNGTKSRKASHIFSIGLQSWSLAKGLLKEYLEIKVGRANEKLAKTKLCYLKKCIVYDNLRKSWLSVNQQGNTLGCVNLLCHKLFFHALWVELKICFNLKNDHHWLLNWILKIPQS